MKRVLAVLGGTYLLRAVGNRVDEQLGPPPAAAAMTAGADAPA